MSFHFFLLWINVETIPRKLTKNKIYLQGFHVIAILENKSKYDLSYLQRFHIIAILENKSKYDLSNSKKNTHREVSFL